MPTKCMESRPIISTFFRRVQIFQTCEKGNHESNFMRITTFPGGNDLGNFTDVWVPNM